MTDIAMRFVLEMLGPISDRPLGAFASVDLREAPDSVCLSLCLYPCVPKEGELIFYELFPVWSAEHSEWRKANDPATMPREMCDNPNGHDNAMCKRQLLLNNA